MNNEPTQPNSIHAQWEKAQEELFKLYGMLEETLTRMQNDPTVPRSTTRNLEIQLDLFKRQLQDGWGFGHISPRCTRVKTAVNIADEYGVSKLEKI